MPTTIDSLQIEISASSRKADAQIDLLIARLEKLENSLIGAGTSGYKNYSNNADNATKRTKTFSDVLKQFDSTSRSVTKTTRSLASAFGKFYANWFMAIRAVKGAWSSIENTADYIEAFNYFNVALGKVGKDWSHQFEQYGYDNAEAYSNSFSERLQKSLSGLSGLKLEIGADGMGILSDSEMTNLGMNIKEITQYASQLASVTNSVGQTGEVSLAASSAFTKLAGDISSLFNLDYSSVAKNLQSGLIGQSRALYKYGIDITNATLQTYAYGLGLEKAVSEMTQAEKMQLRMIAILDQSKVSWGDLANTIMSPSNQIRIFKNNLSELSMVFGQLFVPILSKALPILNAVSVAFRQLLTDIAGFFGIKLDLNSFGKGYSELEEEIDGIGGAFDDATASANKFKTTTFGIDELNINAPQEANGSGTSGIGGGIDLTDEILNATQEYENAWQEAFDNMENRIQEFADKITKALEPIRNMFEKLSFGDFKGAGGELATFFNNLINPDDFGELGQNIGEFLNNALDFGIGFLEEFEWDELGESIATGINEFFKTFDGAKLAEGLNAFVDGVKDGLISLINGITWEDIIEDAKSFLGELELDTVAILIGAFSLKHAGKVLTAISLKNIINGKFNTLITSAFGTGATALGAKGAAGFAIAATVLVSFQLVKDFSEWKENIEKYGWDEGRKITASENAANPYLDDSAYNQKLNDMTLKWQEFQNKISKSNSANPYIDTSEYNKKINEMNEKWSTLKNNISNNFSSFKDGINAFGESMTQFGSDVANMFETLGASISEWWTNDVSIWFTAEKWQETAMGMKDGIETVWDEHVSAWGKNISDWWNKDVSSWFEKKKWQFPGIKDGLSEAFNTAITTLKGIWNTFAEWLNEALNLRFEGFSKTFEILGKSITVGIPAFNVQLGKLPTFDIPKYATGGFPEDGLFFANHNELVGQFSNGRTAVVNNEQIVAGIEYGVERAVERALAPYLSYLPTIAQNTRETADKDMSVNIGDREIARANARGQKSLGYQLITV